MKYIVNEENTCGMTSLSDKERNYILEAMGFPTAKEEQIQESATPSSEQESSEQEDTSPALYEWDDSVFSLDDEVFEIEGGLFLKASELDSKTRMGLDESHEELFINNVSFDESEYSLGDIYDYGEEIYIKLDEFKKGSKSKDKPEDKPDFTTNARKGDKSKTKKGKKDFEKNGKDDDDNGDDDDFDAKDLFGKKKVKSEANGGDDMSDDEIESTMNKAAEKKFGKGSNQAKLHRKASKLKTDPAAEKQAAADAQK